MTTPMTTPITAIWDEFFKAAEEVGRRPPGRGRHPIECRYYKALCAIRDMCEAHGFDPVDYIRTMAPSTPLNGIYITPKDLLNQKLLADYGKLLQESNGAPQSERDWITQRQYLEGLQQRSRVPLDLDPILLCVTNPLSATFRLGCRATPPPPEQLVYVYGKLAAREVQNDRQLRKMLEKNRPWLLVLLRDRFGLDAMQIAQANEPQPTRTSGPP